MVSAERWTKRLGKNPKAIQLLYSSDCNQFHPTNTTATYKTNCCLDAQKPSGHERGSVHKTHSREITGIPLPKVNFLLRRQMSAERRRPLVSPCWGDIWEASAVSYQNFVKCYGGLLVGRDGTKWVTVSYGSHVILAYCKQSSRVSRRNNVSNRPP